MELTNLALEKVHTTISEGGKVLFISTKTSFEAVAQLAKDTDQYYINYRWLGGMLTNWGTISNSIKNLINLIKIYHQRIEFTKNC